MAARAAEQLTDASAAMVTVADDLEKKAKLEEAAKKKAEAEEESSSEEEEDERIGKLRGFVLGKKKSPAETVAYLRSESLGVENAELGIHFLVEALFDEDEPLAPQISDKKAYLIEACKGDAAMQVAILNAVELYVTESAPNDFKKLVAVLKSLYDDDVCEEEAIVKWAGDPKSARKFGVDAETVWVRRRMEKKRRGGRGGGRGDGGGAERIWGHLGEECGEIGSYAGDFGSRFGEGCGGEVKGARGTRGGQSRLRHHRR